MIRANDDFKFVQHSSPGILGAGVGDDTYILSSEMLNGDEEITISDGQGANRIQLLPGLGIAKSEVGANALKLTLSNGSEITVLGASEFEYEAGANAATGETAPSADFSTFANETLGLQVPSSGTANGGPVTIGGTQDVDGNVTLTLDEAIAAEQAGELPYNILPQEVYDFGTGTIAEIQNKSGTAYGVLDSAQIIDFEDEGPNFTWVIEDTLANIETDINTEYPLTYEASSYTLTDVANDLGALNEKQIDIVRGATNTDEFTFTLDEDAQPAITLSEALKLYATGDLSDEYRINTEVPNNYGTLTIEQYITEGDRYEAIVDGASNRDWIDANEIVNVSVEDTADNVMNYIDQDDDNNDLDVAKRISIADGRSTEDLIIDLTPIDDAANLDVTTGSGEDYVLLNFNNLSLDSGGNPKDSFDLGDSTNRGGLVFVDNTNITTDREAAVLNDVNNVYGLYIEEFEGKGIDSPNATIDTSLINQERLYFGTQGEVEVTNLTSSGLVGFFERNIGFSTIDMKEGEENLNLVLFADENEGSARLSSGLKVTNANSINVASIVEEGAIQNTSNMLDLDTASNSVVTVMGDHDLKLTTSTNSAFDEAGLTVDASDFEAELNVTGTASQDIIVGTDGDDIIIGGAGADTLTGGKGADVFKFDAENGGGSFLSPSETPETGDQEISLAFDGRIDVIHDFVFGEDILSLLNSDISSDSLSTLEDFKMADSVDVGMRAGSYNDQSGNPTFTSTNQGDEVENVFFGGSEASAMDISSMLMKKRPTSVT